VEIKLEYRDETGLRKRWLEELPDWETLGEAALTVKEGEREVIVSGTDGRVPSAHHSVSYTEGSTEHWQDCGTHLQEAFAFAQLVLAKGAEAYQ
jgi:hypothetical protein